MPFPFLYFLNSLQSSLLFTFCQRWAAQHVFQVRNTQFHSFVIVVRKAQLRSVSKFVSALCATPQLRILPQCTITVRKKIKLQNKSQLFKVVCARGWPSPPYMYSDGTGGIKGAAVFWKTDFRIMRGKGIIVGSSSLTCSPDLHWLKCAV